MGISKRVDAMLGRKERLNRPIRRSEIVNRLLGANLPVIDVVVNFQERFGGRAYDLRGTRNLEGMELGIFLPIRRELKGKMTFEAESFQENGRTFFACANHNTAQYNFWMDDIGTVYAEDVPIASSAEKYLESEAMRDSLADGGSTWVWLRFSLPRSDKRIEQQLSIPVVDEATDEFTKWWANDVLRVSRRVYWDSKAATDFIEIFCKNRSVADTFLSSLGSLKAEYQPAVGTWPDTLVGS